jgi:hypothetical protein
MISLSFVLRNAILNKTVARSDLAQEKMPLTATEIEQIAWFTLIDAMFEERIFIFIVSVPIIFLLAALRWPLSSIYIYAERVFEINIILNKSILPNCDERE